MMSTYESFRGSREMFHEISISMLPNWTILNSARKYYEEFNNIEKFYLYKHLDLGISLKTHLELFAKYYGKSVAGLTVCFILLTIGVAIHMFSWMDEISQKLFFLMVVLVFFFTLIIDVARAVRFYIYLRKSVMDMDVIKVLES